MIKLVNTSLVALLLIVTFAGLYQPGSIASADEVTETVAAEASPEAVTEQAEATLPPEEPELETPTLEPETDQVTTDPVPTEELAGYADSPPAAETPGVEEDPIIEEIVVEEAPIVEESVVEETPINEELSAEESPTEVDPDESEIERELEETATAESLTQAAPTPAATECGTGDTCPVAKSALATHVGVSITVYDSQTNQVVDSVTVNIWHHGVLVESIAASGTGTVDLELGRSYQVSIFGPGWLDVYTKLTPTETERGFEFWISPEQSPRTQVTRFWVQDAVTREPIEGATFVMTIAGTDSLVDSGTSGTDGSWQAKPVPFMDYQYSVTMDGYKPSRVFALRSYELTMGWVVLLYKAESTPLSIKIVDSYTGSPIAGASFTLVSVRSGERVEGKTSANGEFVTQPIAQRAYTINASAEGYEHVTGLSFEHRTGEPLIVKLRPLSDGTITIITVDEFTSEPVADAYITVFQMVDGYQYGPEVAFGQTNAEGRWTSPLLPAGNYRVDVYPIEHYPQSLDLQVTNDNLGMSVQVYPFNDVAVVDVYVSDYVTKKRVPDAKVTIRQYGVVATGITDSTGSIESPRLPKDMYVFVVEKPGYHTTNVMIERGPLTYWLNLKLVPLNRVHFQLSLNKQCTFSCFGWTASSSTSLGLGVGNGFGPLALQTPNEIEPVVGARVQLQDPVTFEVIAEQYSDQAGSVMFADIYEGTYRLVITGEGLNDYVQVVSLNESTAIELTIPAAMVPYPGNLEPPPDLEIPDDDDDNGTPGTDDGDDSQTPVITNPVDPTNPDVDDPDEVTTPGTDNPTGNENPGTGNQEVVPNPDLDPVTPGESVNPDTSGSTDGSNSDRPTVDESASASGGTGITTQQVSGTTAGSDSSAPVGVSQLPDTGVGPTASRVAIAAIIILAVCGFIGALDVRRRA